MDKYKNLTREDLIREIELIKSEQALAFDDMERKSTNRMLANMIYIRKILSDILKLLLSPGEEVIDQALLLLIPFFKVDRVYIGIFEENSHIVDFTHEVTENEILSLREDLLRKLSQDEIPWWSWNFKAGKDVVIYDVSKMPAEAHKEQHLLELQDVRSLLAVPLFNNQKVSGFIGLDSVKEYRQWSEIDIENLRMLADIISVAIERTQALKEKEKSESRFKDLYQNMPLAYLYKEIVFDTNGKPVDLKYVDINPAAEKTFGFEKESFINNRFGYLVAPFLSKDAMESQIAVAQSKTPLITERIEKYKGKLIKIINYSPFPNHLVTLCTEFSTQPQLQESLLRSEAKFKMIFDKLPWGVELYDHKGYLMDINDADLNIFGTTRADVIGINMFENPNIPEEVNQKLKRGEDVSFRLNYNFKKVKHHQYYSTCEVDGIKHLQVKGVPLKDDQNNIFGFLYIVFDDTENYHKNEQTQNNLAKLRVAMDTGESIIWEYDTKTEKISIDFSMNEGNDDNYIMSFLKENPIKNKEEFIGTLHPEDQEEVYKYHLLPLLEGKIKNYSIMYRRIINGEIIWFMSNVRAYKFNADGKPRKIVSYATDITGKIQMQNKLHQIEKENKMFGYAVSQSNNEIFALDKDARMVFCNQRVIENYNFTKSVSQYVLQDINPRFSQKQWYELREELQTSQSALFETVHHLKTGKDLPVETYIYRVEDKQWGDLYWCFIRDITERIKQRQKISWLNSLMDTLLNNVPVVIAVKNINEGFKHMYFNSAAERFTGKKKEEVLGRTDFEIFDDIQYAQEVRQQDMLAVRNGTNSQYAIEYRTYHGEVRIINSIRLLVNFPKNDNQPMVIVLIWDITDQRKNEIELIKAKEADKLKSAFLANMSHEIRTPLNAIVGFSSIMAETDDLEERHRYKDIIDKNNDLLLQLINDILDFSKIEAGMMDFKRTDTDIKEICEEIYQIHSLKMNSGVKFIFDDAHLPSIIINTDMKRIIQVLSNFITNAVKFTRQGSITISYRQQEKDLFVSVEDTGIGIAEEYKNIIFERFIKVNDFQQGTGLGLPICKMIIENLGGQIGMDSEVGQGSTFWFTLPLKERSTDTTEKKGSPQLPEIRKTSYKKTILIAEDVEENYLLLYTLLGKDYDLFHAWNGEEAIKLFQTHQPDLILMDMKMPVMDGFQATVEIRKSAPQIPIVALSAFAFENERQKAFDSGITEYVVKPIDITSFRKLISRLFEQ